jgi:hypothetical protein
MASSGMKGTDRSWLGAVGVLGLGFDIFKGKLEGKKRIIRQAKKTWILSWVPGMLWDRRATIPCYIFIPGAVGGMVALLSHNMLGTASHMISRSLVDGFPNVALLPAASERSLVSRSEPAANRNCLDAAT